MIEPTRNEHGSEQARVICDRCGIASITVSAAHGETPKRQRGKRVAPVRSEAQVLRKIQQHGWVLVKGAHLCPACNEDRKRAEAPAQSDGQTEDAMKQETITALREPSAKQKREIIAMLEIAYDDEAKRYKGNDTDKTVAEAIGAGIMPGWVGEIREEMFGPDGGNAEIESVLRALEKASGDLKKALDAVNGQATAIAAIKADVVRAQDMTKAATARIETIKAAVGPKVRAV